MNDTIVALAQSLSIFCIIGMFFTDPSLALFCLITYLLIHAFLPTPSNEDSEE